MHVKATDEAAHTKQPAFKRDIIESMDQGLAALPQLAARAVVAVTGDHASPSTGALLHSGDPTPFVVAALRDRELTFRNSKNLHEAYFANLGGNGRRSGAIEAALATAYGTTARWEQHIRATGMGLGGGSGWAILAFELDTGALRTISSGNHTQALSTSVPLLVMDMYEHSYQMDFGAGVARYIDAFFANVSWDEVNRRLERAQRMSAVFRGAPS